MGPWLVLHKGNSAPIATVHTNDTTLLDDQKDTGRKSWSGHIFMMANAAVTWYSKKQPVVTLSLTEAEYYALSKAVKEALWIWQL
ncbi:hypothetical protein CcCBS67573_g10637 [Chytriomyces confervae]|uniref:Uncharacterized protein n=1 Tax=Chytriomyces confervae TaxID=246404 RepID=A0A507CKD5_9FUNG|nr:hypothetical protein CcCBS67573_g10637 [Chytriomyces confervae]